MAPKVHCTKKSTMKLTLHSDNYEEHNVPLPYPKSDPTIKLSLHTIKLPHEEHTIPLLFSKKSKIKPVLTAIQQNQSDHSRLFSSFLIIQVR